MEFPSPFESFESDDQIVLDGNELLALSEAAKWARFLGILGMVLSGLMGLLGVIVMLFGAAMFSSVPGMSGLGSLIGVFYLVIAVVYLFPSLYLYRFGLNIRKSQNESDRQAFTAALSNLKSHYQFIGIMAAILLGLYALAIVGAIFAGIFFAS